MLLSVSLLTWWFRYACGLILKAKPARDYLRDVAAANELGVLDVQQDLASTSEDRELDIIHGKLERDYHLLSFLIHHTPTLKTGGENVEQRVMMVDFEVMKACYGLLSLLSGSRAKWALEEMAQVVCYFANALGERAG